MAIGIVLRAVCVYGGQLLIQRITSNFVETRICIIILNQSTTSGPSFNGHIQHYFGPIHFYHGRFITQMNATVEQKYKRWKMRKECTHWLNIWMERAMRLLCTNGFSIYCYCLVIIGCYLPKMVFDVIAKNHVNGKTIRLLLWIHTRIPNKLPYCANNWKWSGCRRFCILFVSSLKQINMYTVFLILYVRCAMIIIIKWHNGRLTHSLTYIHSIRFHCFWLHTGKKCSTERTGS